MYLDSFLVNIFRTYTYFNIFQNFDTPSELKSFVNKLKYKLKESNFQADASFSTTISFYTVRNRTYEINPNHYRIER